jgi:hypothetical protein
MAIEYSPAPLNAIYGGRDLRLTYDGVAWVVSADGAFGHVQLGRGETKREAFESAREFLRGAMAELERAVGGGAP